MPFEVLPFSRFYRNDRNFLYNLFGLLVPGFMSRESEKYTGILQMVQLNPVPVFGEKKKNASTISRKFFTEIQMVSSVNLSIDTNQPPLVVGVFCRTPKGHQKQNESDV